MTASSAITANFAKSGTEARVGNRCRSLRLTAAVMQKSRSVFPIKTAHYLSDITGYSVRSCEAWLSERVVIPSDALAALIQSEWGRDYLTTIMVDQTPKWWLLLKAWLSSIDFATAQAKQRRKLRDLLDETAAATANAPQDSFAHFLQDAPFYEGQPSPFRAGSSRRRRK